MPRINALNILLESDAPVVVAQSFSILMFFAMAVIMIATAGSTLDSTFTALAKLTARDLRLHEEHGPVRRSRFRHRRS